MRFKPGRRVKGGVERLGGGPRGQVVADISGRWDGQVAVECPELEASGALRIPGLLRSAQLCAALACPCLALRCPQIDAGLPGIALP